MKDTSSAVKGFLAGAAAVVVVLLLGQIRASSAQQSAPAGAAAQAPAAGQGGGGRGRGGLPNATPEQTAAVAQMNSDLASQTQALAAARTAVTVASLTIPRDENDVRAKVAAVKNAEVALANARADAFAGIQASANKLSPEQIAALSAAAFGGGGRGGRGAGGANAPQPPDISADQGRAILAMNSGLTTQTEALQNVRTALAAASLAVPKDGAAIQAKADAIGAAEQALADARAAAFAKIQSSPAKLDADQAAALAAVGGTIGGFGSRGAMEDFNYHKGYVSIFDGKTLKGWDGNPKFWRVEDGAIVGESTAANPSGNTYIVYRDMEAHDFTLKMEIKIEGAGGSGIQYRSKTGIPWTAAISPAVTANTGPVNLNWMMTGNQADFWPTNGPDTFSGQFYVENDPMRIVAWRGEVVQGAGPGTHHVMGTIGDGVALAAYVKKNDWNQYTVIARGGTFIHILNGQLMSVFVDDDPKSTTNQSGYFGIEMEQITKVSARNIWVKKIN